MRTVARLFFPPRMLPAAALLASLCSPARAAQPGDAPPAVVFYRGLFQEIALGDLDAAVATYRALQESAAGDNELASEALIREGICLEKMGREREALSCYDRAIARSPDSTAVVEKAFSEMAIFFSRPAMVHARDKELDSLKEEAARAIAKGEYGAAKDRLRRALLIDPDNHELQLRMAGLCRRSGATREAVTFYNLATADEKYGNDPAVIRALAACYRAIEDYDAAIKLWRAYASGDSIGERERNRIAYEVEVLLEAGDAADGRPLPKRLAELLAASESQCANLDYAEAVRTCRKARVMHPDSWLPPLRLGAIYDFLLEDDGAYGFRKVRDREGEYRMGGRGAVGFAHLGSRDAYSIFYYEEALKNAPLVAAQRIRCRLALLYEKGGDLERAAYHMAQYFSHDVRPVENDGIIMERIRKKRMTDRIRRMRTKP